MLEKCSEQVYVAELKVPTCFYPNWESRRPIEDPTGFGVNKGYYVIGPPDEKPTVSGYVEMVLVIEFVSKGLKEAEDRALRVGRTFGSLASGYGGYPIESPYLTRIACSDINGYLKSQHNYSYRSKPNILSGFDQVVDYQLRQYFRSFSSIDPTTRHQLQSAIHWYGISISADDPTVSYVAAWTGLESIGTVIDRKAHPDGPRVYCETCHNKAGEKRDRKIAGINHMFNHLTRDPLSGSLSDDALQMLERDFAEALSSEDAQELRAALVHGLEDIELLSQKSARSRRFLMHALNASIQIVMGQFVKSWIPDDYGVQPFARHSLRFREGLRWSPYLGEWVAELRGNDQPITSALGGEYAGVYEVEWALRENAVSFIESKGEEVFRRGIDVTNLADGKSLTGLATWHDRPSEIEWREFL